MEDMSCEYDSWRQGVQGSEIKRPSYHCLPTSPQAKILETVGVTRYSDKEAESKRAFCVLLSIWNLGWRKRRSLPCLVTLQPHDADPAGREWWRSRLAQRCTCELEPPLAPIAMERAPTWEIVQYALWENERIAKMRAFHERFALRWRWSWHIIHGRVTSTRSYLKAVTKT